MISLEDYETILSQTFPAEGLDGHELPALDYDRFEKIIRTQLQLFVNRKLASAMRTASSESTFEILAGLKMLLSGSDPHGISGQLSNPNPQSTRNSLAPKPCSLIRARN